MVNDEIEARKKAAEKGWIGEPQPDRPPQMGIIARRALWLDESRRLREAELARYDRERADQGQAH